MAISTKKKDKGYHIRNFDPKARRLAKGGASIAGVDIGSWISQAVREKFARDIAQKAHGVEDTPQAREV